MTGSADPVPAPAGARWIATCAAGLEEILEQEAKSQELSVEGKEVGGVRFRGDLAQGVRGNWRLRTANRVLLELAAWAAPDDDALYRGAFELVAPARATSTSTSKPGTSTGARPPEERESAEATDSLPLTGSSSVSESFSGLGLGDLAELLHPDRTFSIRATSSRSAVRDTRWLALKVKDGIVDAQRRRWGRRASIDRVQPDLALRVRLRRDRATLLLDTSGEPLDRRGYRVAPTPAPLREQLAAAAICASGWGGRGPVVDLFCGSGTLLAEAGAIALGLPPQRLRRSWGFERLPGWRPEILERVRAEPIPRPGPGVELFGVDLDAAAVEAARRNLAAAGLGERARLSAGDGLDFEPPEGPGLVAVNPPWGERLEENAELWRRLGDRLKRRYGGWKAVLVAGGSDRGKTLGLRPARRIPVRSGPLEVRLLVLDLW